MNRMTEFALSLANSILRTLYIIFPLSSELEENTRAKKEPDNRSSVRSWTFLKVDRTTELATGLAGCVLGLLSIVLVILIGGIGVTFKFDGTAFGSAMEFISPLFAMLAIVGVIFGRYYPKPGGWLIIIAAVAGFAVMPYLYLPSGILLLISGFMGIQRGNLTEQNN